MAQVRFLAAIITRTGIVQKVEIVPEGSYDGVALIAMEDLED